MGFTEAGEDLGPFARTSRGVIVTTSVPPDAVIFDGDHVRIEAIRPENEYAGTRAVRGLR